MDVSTGKSDPYVIVRFGSKMNLDKLPEKKTPVKYRCRLGYPMLIPYSNLGGPAMFI